MELGGNSGSRREPMDQTVASLRDSGCRKLRRPVFQRTSYRLKKALRSPSPYLMAVGLALWISILAVLTAGLQLPRFVKILWASHHLQRMVLAQSSARHLDLHPEYYHHIYVSCRRILDCLLHRHLDRRCHSVS